MAQLNLYLPDAKVGRLKAEARRAGVSLSHYVGMLIDGKPSAWPPDFFKKQCAFLREDLAIPTDPPPEPVEWR